MRTAIAAHELLPEGLYLENLSIGAGRVSICAAASGTRRSRCPLCGRGSSRVHSRYTRTVSDLPWHGISVELEVRARRFLCEEASCERKIFCERLPDVAARARKTGRLEEALLAISCWSSAAGPGPGSPPSWGFSSGAMPCSRGPRALLCRNSAGRCGCWVSTISPSAAGRATGRSWWTSNAAGWWTCCPNARRKASWDGWSGTPRWRPPRGTARTSTARP
jgi:hypothetical protein